MARSFATKVVKKKTTSKVKAKTPVKKKAVAKPAAKAKKTLAAKKKAPARKKVVKKVVKKKKKVAKKKVVAKPKKKVPTELQKAKAVKAKARDEITQLKETALLASEPKRLPDNAWTVFVTEKVKGTDTVATGTMKTSGGAYKTLTASELEHYNHVANQNRAANEKAYAAWVNSHTPQQIRAANSARSLLKRRATAGAYGARKSLRGLSKIKDKRMPKRPSTAYLLFSVERHLSGDLKNIPLTEKAALITQEWKALSPAELKKYEDLQAADQARYVREHQTVYGHPVPTPKRAKVAA